MTNKTFHLTVPAADEELAADRLWQLGVEAVGIGPDIEGKVELWTSVGGSTAAIERAVASLDPSWTWRTEDVVEPHETWRDYATPNVYAEDGVVVPAWQVADLDVAGGVVVTAIEPATSFGLGDHPTTTLSLAMLAERLAERSAGVTVDSVLDVGCGSGVLGVMAAQRGVKVVRATDVSAGAVEATAANAELNAVSEQIEVDLAVLEDLSGDYDLVVANILAPVLVSLAPQLRRLTAASGRLVISGILADDHTHVLEALAPLRVESTVTRGGWAAVRLRH